VIAPSSRAESVSDFSQVNGSSATTVSPLRSPRGAGWPVGTSNAARNRSQRPEPGHRKDRQHEPDHLGIGNAQRSGSKPRRGTPPGIEHAQADLRHVLRQFRHHRDADQERRGDHGSPAQAVGGERGARRAGDPAP
jgi:hypothetical protein